MLTDYTIDGPESKDLDDAIRLIEKTDTGWKVVVAVTNVARVIHPGKPYDIEARQRGETRYHARGSRPMLPRFKERDLSLLPGKRRDVMCVEVELDEALNPGPAKVYFDSKFKNRCRLSYPDIPAILHDPEHPAHEGIKLASELALAMLERRRKAGAFVIYDMNTGWVTDEEGFLMRLARRQDTIGYIIIQEMMILANAALAAFCATNDIPVLYRNHTAKAHAPERAELLEALGQIRGSAPARLETLRLQTHMVLNKATIEPVLRGHYGLNLPGYIWMTSPIRRYADLVNQRQVRAFLRARRKETDPEYPHSMEELVEIGEHLVGIRRAEQEAKHEHFKSKAYAEAQDAIDANTLIDIRTKDFDKVVKLTVAQAVPPEAFSEALHARLLAGRVSVLALYRVLLETAPGDAWAALRTACLTHLGSNPFMGISIVNTAQNVLGWKDIHYQERKSGPAHALVFEVKAQCGPLGGEWVSGSNLKLQRQRAVVALLASAAGGTLPEFNDSAPRPKSSKKKAKHVPLPSVDATNPIAALQEYGQQSTPQQFPSYQFTRTGEDHTPAHTCQAVFGPFEVEVTVPGKKKLSKVAAAKALIEALHS